MTVQAAFAQAGGDLHADEAGAQNHGGFAAFGLCQDCVGIRSGAQQEDVAQMGAGQAGQARGGAGGQQGSVVAKCGAVGAGDGFAGGVQGGDLGGAALDAVFPVEGLGLERGFLGAWLSRKVVFAEQGAVVGDAIVTGRA